MLSKRTRRIIFSILAGLQIFALNTPFALAQIDDVYLPPDKANQLGEDIGSDLGNTLGPNLGSSMAESFATEAAATLEERYNLNLASIQDQGQNFNVSQDKMLGPQVMLSFNPLAPKPNEEITATAVPMYFGNDPKNMYFTWYIKHAGCDLGISGLALPDRFLSEEKKDLKERCDVDSDGTITVNDWKVDAMRKIAGNDFNWTEADYLGVGDGVLPPNKTAQDPEGDSRGDGYYAYFGGEDQKATDVNIAKAFVVPDDIKSFVCNLFVLANPTLESIEENYPKIFEQIDGSCEAADSDDADTDELTTQEKATACIEDETCSTTGLDTVLASTLSTQELAGGCSNHYGTTGTPNFDLDADGDTTDDSYSNANGGAGLLEDDCYTATASPYYLSSLATSCQNDSDETCPITASLLKYYGSASYSNLYTNACNSSFEKDCAKNVTPFGDKYATAIEACAADASCPRTALLTQLLNTSDGRDLLASACDIDGSTCKDNTQIVANTKARLVAAKEILTFIIENGTEIAKLLPEYADEIKNIQEKLNELPNLLNAVDFKNFTQQCKGKNSDVGAYGLLAQYFPAIAALTANVQCYKDLWEQLSGVFDEVWSLLDIMNGAIAHCYIHDFATGTEYEIGTSCNKKLHLFGKGSGLLYNRPGNGWFGPAEESFWHTNPEDTSTADNGQVDEANVVGLGQNKFTWTYQPGDQVGVAVEGVSIMASKYDDATQKVMWALPRNIFNDGECTLEQNGLIEKMIKGYKVRIPKAKVDLNKCLEPNLIDPTAGGQAEKIEIALSYTPKNPTNNALPATAENDKKKADTLEVQASISSANVTDKALVNYTWTAAYSTATNASTTEWTTIPVEVMKKLTTQNVGKGLDKFRMSLNLKNEDLDIPDGDDINFLKVSVNAKDTAYGSINHEGRKTIIIPLFSTSNQIFVYPIIIDNGDLSAAATSTITLDETYDPLTDENACITGNCLVMKNDIIGLKFADTDTYSNFSWMIDNVPFTPIGGCGDACATDDTEKSTFGANTNIAYFPVTKDVGQNHVVTLNADGAYGKKLTLTKVFTVVEPQLKLFAKDFSTTTDPSTITSPVLRGNYIAPDESRTPDFDYSAFETAENTKVKITAISNFDQNKISLKNFSWTINGGIKIDINEYGIVYVNDEISQASTDGKLQISSENTQIFLENGLPDLEIINTPTEKALIFTATKTIGSSYSFSAQATYAQPNSLKLALQKNWGIPTSDFYERGIDDTIELSVENLYAAQRPTQKVLATIFSGFPLYFSFLLKLALAAMVILFSSWLIISFPFKKNAF